MGDVLFEPLQFRNLTVKNRVLRSNVSGRFDNYDGSGTQTRINWETKFARGGVGAIVSSFVPVTIRGRIVPNYATIDRDERVPFWRAVGEAVHAHDCRFILQLSHAGRQRDIPGIEYDQALSSTGRDEPLHGFPCVAMTPQDIADTVAAFAAGARRARAANLDGVELHAANGYLFTQFLSSAINDRTDEYGGPLRQRARFLLEVVAAIRAEVGHDFHLQVKISAEDHNDAITDDEGPGNTLADTLQVCQWLEQAGVDALHVSTGSFFPHPRNPPGGLPIDELIKTYDQLLSSGGLALRNYLFYRGRLTRAIVERRWREAGGERIEGINLPAAQAIRQAVGIPVLCTGGFQTAAIIREAIRQGFCDAVTIARPLIANNDLVQQFAAGIGRPPRPCTYCNKCLVNAVENPLGCYEEARYPSREAMIDEIMSVFSPPPFT